MIKGNTDNYSVARQNINHARQVANEMPGIEASIISLRKEYEEISKKGKKQDGRLAEINTQLRGLFGEFARKSDDVKQCMVVLNSAIAEEISKLKVYLENLDQLDRDGLERILGQYEPLKNMLESQLVFVGNQIGDCKSLNHLSTKEELEKIHAVIGGAVKSYGEAYEVLGSKLAQKLKIEQEQTRAAERDRQEVERRVGELAQMLGIAQDDAEGLGKIRCVILADDAIKKGVRERKETTSSTASDAWLSCDGKEMSLSLLRKENTSRGASDPEICREHGRVLGEISQSNIIDWKDEQVFSALLGISAYKQFKSGTTAVFTSGGKDGCTGHLGDDTSSYQKMTEHGKSQMTGITEQGKKPSSLGVEPPPQQPVVPPKPGEVERKPVLQ